VLVKIKRLDKSLPLPAYQTPGATAMDLYCSQTITIKPQQTGQIHLGVAIKLPKGTFGILAARSSTHKMGLMPVNGIGIIDSDFGGDNDEWRFLALNFTKKAVTIEKETRVAQFLVFKYEKIKLKEVNSLGHPNRGGFGSTGSN